ncbi:MULTISPECIES: polysaccharide pyruvyl transferase family protein [unclassified Halomonas]|uniref:polysaccharide pyruvyl transferase family protein n=1 Tax=unclassified Halomonas TaxID=2609666 RepID=UPI00055038BE|nr:MULTISPECIES: polysaccharide pyruvyl transferase family protein [unclassified Halomonas]
MKNYLIIGTYPEKGSKNIGDKLITESVIKGMSSVDPGCKCEVVFRADSWSNVQAKVKKADHIIFACLAVRYDLEKVVYPFIRNVVDSKTPYSVISSGTSLLVSESEDIYAGLDKATIKLLLKMDEEAFLFSSRGVLTQFLFSYLGMKNAMLDGDVAFYSPERQGLSFRVGDKKVRKIIISDPHYASSYIESFIVLYSGVVSIFPMADVEVCLHGINPDVENFCIENGLKCNKIYELNNGLNVYDSCDLHIGYRVHAHVSALSRRKFSYLIEQDGRGADYGATITRKISQPCYVGNGGNGGNGGKGVNVSAIYQLLAILYKDKESGFIQFSGLEKQIDKFSMAAHDAFCKIASA